MLPSFKSLMKTKLLTKQNNYILQLVHGNECALELESDGK